MCLWFDGVAERAGIVGIGWAFDGFVSDDAVEYANFPIQAIADRYPQEQVSLANGEISRDAIFRTGPEALSAKRIRIGAGP